MKIPLLHSPSRRIRRLARLTLGGISVLAAASLGVGMLTGFHLGTHELQTHGTVTADSMSGVKSVVIPDGIRVEQDITYGVAADGTLLKLDACLPASARGKARPALIGIHGGSWQKGDKATPTWRLICRWLASEGFVSYSINYRLVPDVTYPAAIEDVTMALKWAREPQTVQRFHTDPQRIGAIGGSAGANLAAQLGMRGDGPTDEGTRVAAVVDLSGPVDLTAFGLTLGDPIPYVEQIEKTYLGCTSLAADCPQAEEASAVYQVDPTDPPVFIAHSEHELIPKEQGDEFAAVLSKAGVANEEVVMPGTRHADSLLDATMRERVADFLHQHLG